MLIRFSIENFLSFKDRQTFSMIAGRSRKKPFHVMKKENEKDVNLLKAGVLFGANASGKSNFVKAIEFGQKLILKGTPVDTPIQVQNFRLHKESIALPTRFEYEIKHRGNSYAYGFVVGERVEEEWLYKIDKKKDTLIFERKNSSEFKLDPLLEINSKAEESQFIHFIAKGTPDNQLFLTEVKNRKVVDNVSDVEDLLDVIDWFQNALTVFYPSSKMMGVEFELQKNTELTTVFEEFLNYFDTGINGISLEAIDFDEIELPNSLKEQIKKNLLNEKSEKTVTILENSRKNISYVFSKNDKNAITARKLMTKHKVHGGHDGFDLFDVNEESDGTQRIMDFIPVLIDLFKGDNVFIIDEMERSLHPNLIYDLLDLFLEKSKDVNSQLILASHASSLLTQKLLRKDEIWFAKKDEMGATELYSLEDYDIRFDKQIMKDYLLGRYQAIPRLGNRNDLSALNTNN